MCASWVVSFDFQILVFQWAYCFELSPALKIFWSRFSLQWVLSFVFERTRILVEVLDCSSLSKQNIACNLCVKLIFMVFLLCSPLVLWPFTSSCFSKVFCWKVWKCAFHDFLIIVSNLFFLLLDRLVYLETPILLSFHSCWIDNLQSFLVVCFQSLSLW